MEFVVQLFVLPEKDRQRMIERVSAFLAACLPGKRVKVTIERFVKTRSTSQNAYLWGVCYATILRQGGEDFGGWTPDDLHEFMLGDWGGWQTREFEGYTRQVPLRRSSRLSTIEFGEFVAHIQLFASRRGMYIPDPGEAAA